LRRGSLAGTVILVLVVSVWLGLNMSLVLICRMAAYGEWVEVELGELAGGAAWMPGSG
jgi:hypothetical protein